MKKKTGRGTRLHVGVRKVERPETVGVSINDSSIRYNLAPPDQGSGQESCSEESSGV